MNKKGHRISAGIAGILVLLITLFTPLESGWEWNDIFYIGLAFLVGYWLPDIDQQVDFFHHRSIWTHSCFISVGVCLAFDCLASGVLSFLVGIHLMCDLKLKQKGFGRISYGINKRMGGDSTDWWLAINGMVSISLGLVVMWT